jgi:F1F0 ATPase subunit 2
MDEERMTTLPAASLVLDLAAHLAGGVVLGTLYFGSLWWSTQRFAAGGRALPVIAATLGRFLLLGAALVSRAGALPLLATALGILAARAGVMRRVREAAP